MTPDAWESETFQSREGKNMPQDPRKRQKALMKKRSKQKAASEHRWDQEGSMSVSIESIIRRGREFPLYECWISANWQKDDLGLVEIIVARQQPDGNICFGTYLVDKYCLGLKNTFARAGFSHTRYHDEVPGKLFHEMKSMKCPVELAHQMISPSIDYAVQLGFTPEKDYTLTPSMLAPPVQLADPTDLPFGYTERPLFVAA